MPQPPYAIADFRAASTSGEDFHLSAAGTRFVVLYFYPKDDTPGCTIESGDFSRLLPAFAAADAVVLGVSRDGMHSHDCFRDKFSYAHHLVADTDGALCAQFRVVRPDGKFSRSTFLITTDAMQVVEEWRDIGDVSGHAQAVLEAVQARAKN